MVARQSSAHTRAQTIGMRSPLRELSGSQINQRRRDRAAKERAAPAWGAGTPRSPRGRAAGRPPSPRPALLATPDSDGAQPGSPRARQQLHAMKVRLQLAYYKYRTNQAHLNFHQLKQRYQCVKPRTLACTAALRTPVKVSGAGPSPTSTPTSVKAAKSLLQLFSASAAAPTEHIH
ncbi:AFL180Cp [Eremothecium gossypii ATCC 10895]|uniref:AFL180Cp n=1 Tax=Eremothecium gossypii (strain ATCC 10895 / CBS 109.51 / FGSC 9923 / NRRL Y-1056) TaxID=284811 RepID=Q755Q8_EREGS|nr:AFL180Cp [Eremothecium gossypii ATCC 10895]AAS53194.2 AFL180Cp [Eremothecium gossypii ATCC 10895]AEY97504.1 FAFL180Cp [Eremothecium gossypii FDAG1]